MKEVEYKNQNTVTYEPRKGVKVQITSVVISSENLSQKERADVQFAALRKMMSPIEQASAPVREGAAKASKEAAKASTEQGAPEAPEGFKKAPNKESVEEYDPTQEIAEKLSSTWLNIAVAHNIIRDDKDITQLAEDLTELFVPYIKQSPALYATHTGEAVVLNPVHANALYEARQSDIDAVLLQEEHRDCVVVRE